MRFKIDENLPAEIADDLRALEHDAMTVVDQGMIGIDDQRLMIRVATVAEPFYPPSGKDWLSYWR